MFEAYNDVYLFTIHRACKVKQFVPVRPAPNKFKAIDGCSY